MEEIKNVIVEQKDILDIIKSLNQHFLEKQKVFDETERLVKEEEVRYEEWNKAKYASQDFANYPAFERQVFHNKRTHSAFTIDISYIDGSSLNGKSVDETLETLGVKAFDKIESITINLNLSYQLNYKADDYSADSANRVSQDVYLKFREDSIYYSVSGENCDAEVTDIKNIILDKFRSLEPRLSNLITKRKSLKYKATLYVSFLLSAILVSLAAFLIKKYVTFFDMHDYRFAYIPLWFVLSFVINAVIPSAKLSKWYSLIIPKQSKEYSSYDKAYHNVDNIKDFVAYPEVQIGANAKKANIRKAIKDHLKKSKVKAIVTFVLGLVCVAAVALIII